MKPARGRLPSKRAFERGRPFLSRVMCAVDVRDFHGYLLKATLWRWGKRGATIEGLDKRHSVRFLGEVF